MWSWGRAIKFVVCFVLLAAACHTPATEIIVVVDADLDIPGELSRVIVEVMSPSGEMNTATTSVFVDGDHREDQEHRTDDGDLATLNWQTNSERFGLGNEFVDDRLWSGTIALVAIFDQALTADEIEQLFTSGPDGGR